MPIFNVVYCMRSGTLYHMKGSIYLMFYTLYTSETGDVMEHPGFKALGRSGMSWVEAAEEEMIPLPKGASLVSVPGFYPVGLDQAERLRPIQEHPLQPGERVHAVAALLPQGFTRTLVPACVNPGQGCMMPLMGYAAVGLNTEDEQIYVAAVQTDEHRKWHPAYYNTEGLPARIARLLKQYPENRILRQLARCSLEYGCFTAQNLFYGRWEAGIPTYTACNANCIGCISESHTGTDSPQIRLDFLPTVDEIAELGIHHLDKAREGIISFGQGCEGEPALNARRLAPAIRKIRQKTDKGTININTNAGYSQGIQEVCDAGLDAMRVTIFSADEASYNYYHQPRDYGLQDVCQSIKYAKGKGVRVSLNLLVYPGFTDTEKQIEALLSFARQQQVDMIQMRNLNMDPDRLFQGLNLEEEGIGIINFLALLQEELPEVEIGSYSWPVRE